MSQARQTIFTGVILPLGFALVIVVGAFWLAMGSSRERVAPASANQSGIPAEEKCEAPTGNLKSFGNEITQLIIRHNAPLLSGGLPDESAASEARGKLDYAERCRHGFSFEGAGLTEDDLKAVGYLPRGRRP